MFRLTKSGNLVGSKRAAQQGAPADVSVAASRRQSRG